MDTIIRATVVYWNILFSLRLIGRRANHAIVSAVKERSPLFRKIVEGTPVVVVENGKTDENLLHGLRMAPENVSAAARQEGVEEMSQIQLGIVERRGLTIVKSK